VFSPAILAKYTELQYCTAVRMIQETAATQTPITERHVTDIADFYCIARNVSEEQIRYQ